VTSFKRKFTKAVVRDGNFSNPIFYTQCDRAISHFSWFDRLKRNRRRAVAVATTWSTLRHGCRSKYRTCVFSTWNVVACVSFCNEPQRWIYENSVAETVVDTKARCVTMVARRAWSCSCTVPRLCRAATNTAAFRVAREKWSRNYAGAIARLWIVATRKSQLRVPQPNSVKKKRRETCDTRSYALDKFGTAKVREFDILRYIRYILNAFNKIFFNNFEPARYSDKNDDSTIVAKMLQSAWFLRTFIRWSMFVTRLEFLTTMICSSRWQLTVFQPGSVIALTNLSLSYGAKRSVTRTWLWPSFIHIFKN